MNKVNKEIKKKVELDLYRRNQFDPPDWKVMSSIPCEVFSGGAYPLTPVFLDISQGEQESSLI